jgi:hypothetical protein
VALRRLSTSSIQTNGKSSKLWDQTTFQSGMFALATVSLTSTASSIVFDSIPSNYTHLQIRMLARSTTANTQDGIKLVFNSDTTANYSNHDLWGNGISVGSGALTGGSATYGRTFAITAANTSASIFGVSIIDILDYSSTSKTKTVKAITGNDQNGAGEIDLSSINWRNSANAISTITLSPVNGSTLAANTTAALYGIKAG